MRIALMAAAAALTATAALAADPVVPPEPTTRPVITMPVSAAPGETCAALITKAKAETLPADPDKARTARTEIRAADEANDDASCRLHVKAALDAMDSGPPASP